MNKIAIVIDCGATKIGVSAITEKGDVAASVGFPNSPVYQQGFKDRYLIWDIDDIWKKVRKGLRAVTSSVGKEKVAAVAVTTFGADGAPVESSGKLTYPVISWACGRTQKKGADLIRKIPEWELFRISGYPLMPFNTILRLLWLRENCPGALERAKVWLMTPGLISYRLCGEFSIDTTIAATTMMMQLKSRCWSERLLNVADIENSFLPRLVEPGEVIGKVGKIAARQTGLKEGTPVVAAGHDTQFAGIGAGAKKGDVVLSTGTWEILVLRTDRFTPGRYAFENGMLIGNDPVPGMWNPQMLMMASGAVEWIRKYFYSGVKSRQDIYCVMADEAGKLSPGSGGILVVPSFMPGTGPAKRFGTSGTVLGLTINSTRAQLYRAMLEGICFQTRHALHIMIKATGVKPSELKVVGGGSKNKLWNQLRADITGIPIRVAKVKEATSLGAAVFCFVGTGTYRTVEEAQKLMCKSAEVYVPVKRHRETYDNLYSTYIRVPDSLKGVYGQMEGY
jgi:L-fuculokinase